MYVCLLPQNQHLCKQVAIITMHPDHIGIHIPPLIRIERGLEWESGRRTSKMFTFLEKSTYQDCLGLKGVEDGNHDLELRKFLLS